MKNKEDDFKSLVEYVNGKEYLNTNHKYSLDEAIKIMVNKIDEILEILNTNTNR